MNKLRDLQPTHPSPPTFMPRSCGTMLMAQNGKFEALGSGYLRDETGAQQEFTRVGDSGVIDVDAIEDTDVIDVD